MQSLTTSSKLGPFYQKEGKESMQTGINPIHDLGKKKKQNCCVFSTCTRLFTYVLQQRTTTLVHIKKKKIKVAERLSNLFHFIYLMNVVWKLIFVLLLMEVQLIYNIVLVSGLQQSDSVIHIYIYTYSCICVYSLGGFPGDLSGKEPACLCRRLKRHGFDPWVRKTPEEGIATHSSIFAWRSPWRVRHD